MHSWNYNKILILMSTSNGYGIGFDRKETFPFDNGFGRNSIIFGVDMNSSVHVDNKNNKKKYILVLDEGPAQGLDSTTLTAEKKIQLVLLKIIKSFILACIII